MRKTTIKVEVSLVVYLFSYLLIAMWAGSAIGFQIIKNTSIDVEITKYYPHWLYFLKVITYDYAPHIMVYLFTGFSILLLSLIMNKNKRCLKFGLILASPMSVALAVVMHTASTIAENPALTDTFVVQQPQITTPKPLFSIEEYDLLRILVKYGQFAMETEHLNEHGIPEQVEVSVAELKRDREWLKSVNRTENSTN